MLIYPKIDPVFVDFGVFSIHWYGMMYLLAAGILYFLGRWRCRVNSNRPFHPDLMSEYLLYLMIGVIVGGRLGHVLFYNPGYYLANPLDILMIYKGGMSFHGAFLGIIIALILFARRYRVRTVEVFDFFTADIPIGLMLGRIGNFINGELWGRVSDVPWAMVFEHVDSHPRHPSMLYEAILEGPILWLIIAAWRRWASPRPGSTAILFCFGYAFFRFMVEYVREPEKIHGVHYFGAIELTTGQLLSLFMVVVGVGAVYWQKRQPLPRPIKNAKNPQRRRRRAKKKK